MRRSIRIGVWIGVVLAGCSSAPTNEGDTNVSNLEQGEEEQAVLADDVRSRNSKATGVHHWKASLVTSPKYGLIVVGTAYPKAGSQNPTYEMVVTTKGRKPIFRMADPTKPFKANARLRQALAADLKVIATALKDASSASTSTKSIQPQIKFGDFACWLGRAASIFSTAGDLLSGFQQALLTCDTGAVSLEDAIPRCAQAFGTTFGTAKQSVSAFRTDVCSANDDPGSRLGRPSHPMEDPPDEPEDEQPAADGDEPPADGDEPPADGDDPPPANGANG